jgi:multidrug efflux pump subunit AcrA (membrane-fusion protein)
MDEEDLVFRAKVTLEGDIEDLEPGMSVYAEVITGEKTDVLIVPREAIILRDGKEAVFLLKGRRARETVVELGIKDAEKVEIVSGLKEKDRVAISNLEKLKDGTRIRVVR